MSSAVSPDVLLGVVQHCSLVLASPGTDGDIVSALWVYIRHRGLVASEWQCDPALL